MFSSTRIDAQQPVEEFGFEGVIAKRNDSCYEIGRLAAHAQVQGKQAHGLVMGGYMSNNLMDADRPLPLTPS
mgnify:CR=1 FL=1